MVPQNQLLSLRSPKRTNDQRLQVGFDKIISLSSNFYFGRHYYVVIVIGSESTYRHASQIISPHKEFSSIKIPHGPNFAIKAPLSLYSLLIISFLRRYCVWKSRYDFLTTDKSVSVNSLYESTSCGIYCSSLRRIDGKLGKYFWISSTSFDQTVIEWNFPSV